MKKLLLLTGVACLLFACGKEVPQAVTIKAPQPLAEPYLPDEVLNPVAAVGSQEVRPPVVERPQNTPPVATQPKELGCPTNIKNELADKLDNYRTSQSRLAAQEKGSALYQSLAGTVAEDLKDLRGYVSRKRSEGYSCTWPNL